MMMIIYLELAEKKTTHEMHAKKFLEEKERLLAFMSRKCSNLKTLKNEYATSI
jgi:hypothetical protein